jgi:hypothetical protein
MARRLGALDLIQLGSTDMRRGNHARKGDDDQEGCDNKTPSATLHLPNTRTRPPTGQQLQCLQPTQLHPLLPSACLLSAHSLIQFPGSLTIGVLTDPQSANKSRSVRWNLRLRRGGESADPSGRSLGVLVLRPLALGFPYNAMPVYPP